MKKFLTLGLLAGMMSFSQAALAEKVGYVNMQRVVDSSAYSQRLKGEITRELTALGEELRSLQQSLVTLQQKYQKDQLTMTASQKKKLEKEIRTKSFELKVKEASLKEESKYREKEALDLVSKRALNELEKIAKSGGYDVVVHHEAVLYATEAVDLTSELAEALK